jgi:subtilisin family serine protease
MRFSKKILSLIFAVSLLFPVLPAPAFAAAAAGSSESAPLVQAFAEAEEAGACVEGELLVIFKENVGEPEAENAVEAVDGEILDIADIPGEEALAALVELPEDATPSEAAETLSQDPTVDFVQPNYIYELADGEEIAPAFSSDDTYAPNSWHLDGIGVAAAWDTLAAIGSKPRVRVAVLDNNAYMAHEDLAANMRADLARDFSSGLELAPRGSDYEAHATHVSGIIGAAANNGKGVAGVAAGKSGGIVEIVPINVFSGDGATSYALTEAIGYAVGIHAKVINMSLGFIADTNYDKHLKNTVSNAISSGVTVVCAAGNVTTRKPPFPVLPSDFDGVVSVVNLDKNDRRHSSSNYGGLRDISAPGTEIAGASTSPAGSSEYAAMTGTSMASPVVAGVAAMMLYVNGDLSPAEIEDILKKTATTLADKTATGGKVNAAKAVSEAVNRLALEGSVSISGASGTSGAPRFGDTLTANHAWKNSPAPTGISYQWKRDGAAMADATSQNYKVVGADIGHSLSVTVTAGNYAGGVTSDSTSKAIRAAAPAITWPNISAPVVYGTALAEVPLSPNAMGSFAWKHPSTVPDAGNAEGYDMIFTPNADTLANHEPISDADKNKKITLTVNKANAPDGAPRIFFVKAGAGEARSYEFDMSTLLPDVGGWDGVVYSPAIQTNEGVLDTLNHSDNSDKMLTLPVLADAADQKTATVDVTVNSKNYNGRAYTLTVKASSKNVIAITSGIAAVTSYPYDGTGKDGYAVSGAVEFSNGVSISNPKFIAHYTGTPNGKAANSYDKMTSPAAAGIYSLRLELVDDDNYAEWTSKFTIEKAEPAAPASPAPVEYGKKLKDVRLNGIAWKDSPETSVGDVASSPHSFAAVYTPQDTNNYKIVEVSVPVTVMKKPLVVEGLTAVNRAYDGTADVTLMGGRLAGIVAGDEGLVGFTLGGATLPDKYPGAGKKVSVAVALTGARAANYAAVLPPSPITAEISRKPITAEDLTISAQSKRHDGTDKATLTAVFKPGAVVAGDDLRVALEGRYADANAGYGKPVNVTGWSLEGKDKDNYLLDGPLPSGVVGGISSGDESGGASGASGGSGGGFEAPKDEEAKKEAPAKEEADKTANAVAESGAPVATVTVESKPALNADTGRLAAAVEAETVIKAVEEAKKAATDAAMAGKANAVAEVKLSVKSEVAKDATGVSVPVKSAEIGIPAEAVKAVAAAKNLVLTAQSDLSIITLDSATLTGVAAAAKAGDTIRITAETLEKTEAESSRLLEKAGDNTVIELTVSVGDKPVRNFAGSVTVSLPYAPNAALEAEDRDLLTVYFLGDEGDIREMKGARYDARTGMITFTTEHFGKFFVSGGNFGTASRWHENNTSTLY